MTVQTRITIADVKREAAKLGAEVTGGPSGRGWAYYIDLPPGKVFCCNGGHGITGSCLAGFPGDREDMLRDFVEQMAYGVKDGCESSDPSRCDVCNPPTDDEVGT